PPTAFYTLSLHDALPISLLFAHGQTTERTVLVAERLGRALGVPVTALPYWGQLTVEIDGTTLSKIIPVKPLGVDMGKVLAVTTVDRKSTRLNSSHLVISY